MLCVDVTTFFIFKAEKQVSAEDRFLSHCFLQTIDVKCQGTADRKGQQRFVGMDPNFMATFRGDKGYFKKVFEYWGKATGGFKWGIDLISEQLIGFYKVKSAAHQNRIYALFHPEVCQSILVQNMLEAGVEVKGVV